MSSPEGPVNISADARTDRAAELAKEQEAAKYGVTVDVLDSWRAAKNESMEAWKTFEDNKIGPKESEDND